MLDETTCPVCGKQFAALHEAGRTASHEDSARAARWAVAHYLAHLVQQKHNVALPDGSYDVHGGIAIQRLDRTVGSP